jgi:tRNA uridine 5-carboxymethylaminomethyl modification enzyme
MFTSRAEFRLHLRIDNADRRLSPHGRRVGLISNAAWADHEAKQQRLQEMKRLLGKTKLTGELAKLVSASEPVPQDLSSALSSALGQSLAQLLKRPEITIEQLAPALRELAPEFFRRSVEPLPTDHLTADRLPTDHLPSEVRNELKSVETEIKYAGYLDQQQRAIDRLKKAEQRRIPDWFDYQAVSGLSREMQEKLGKVAPETLGQASSIPGVTPAAVSLINVYIEIQARRRHQVAAL